MTPCVANDTKFGGPLRVRHTPEVQKEVLNVCC